MDLNRYYIGSPEESNDYFSIDQVIMCVSVKWNLHLIIPCRTQPFDVFLASQYYQYGRGGTHKAKWQVNQKVVSALDAAFELCLKVCNPNNKYKIQ